MTGWGDGPARQSHGPREEHSFFQMERPATSKNHPPLSPTTGALLIMGSRARPWSRGRPAPRTVRTPNGSFFRHRRTGGSLDAPGCSGNQR